MCVGGKLKTSRGMTFLYRPRLSPTKVDSYKDSRSLTLHSALDMFFIEISTIPAQ